MAFVEIIRLSKELVNVAQLTTTHARTYNLTCVAEVAQEVEQRTENPRVVSSTLTLGTMRK